MNQSVNEIAKELWEFCDSSFQECKCDKDQVFKCNYTFWYPHTTVRNVRLEECRELEGYCSTIGFTYFCQFYNKYSSEVYYTLKTYNEIHGINFNEYKILSIGCGPCTELLGFLKYYEDNDTNNTPVSFTGIDINLNWQSIHNKWKEILDKESSVKFIINPSSISYSPNILLLNYVLSHVSQYNTQKEQSEFFEYIATIVKTMDSNSIILVTEENNTNPDSGIKTVEIIEKLYEFLNATNLLENRIKYQFPLGNSSKDRYSDYGRQHTEKKGVIIPNPPVERPYSRVDWCTGLQNIMVVK